MKLRYARAVLAGRFCLWLSAVWVATADVPAGQRSGCPDRCGDVDIPFPYGIGKECAMQTGFQFDLACDSVNGTEKPFFRGIEVTKISVEDGKAWMKLGISSQCYDQQTRKMKYNEVWADFDRSPFWLSADNKIIAIGCRTLAYMSSNAVSILSICLRVLSPPCPLYILLLGLIIHLQILQYVIGCVSSCNYSTPVNGICSGVGCCQVDVPGRIFWYQGIFDENYNTTEIWRSSPCSYMVLMEKKSFQFSTTYLNSTVFNETYKGKVPVVLDWVITLDTCEEAKSNRSSYACVSTNSDCVDDPSGGYRCRCSNGYQGNPYIKDGCQGASVGLVILVITITCACLIHDRRKLKHIKNQYFRRHGGLLLYEEMKSKQGLAFKIFSEEELQQATNRFDEHQVLGQGGNGIVYKGHLKDDLEVAVKRCMTIDKQKEKEFGKEMLILSQINHKNIVKLLGCCLEVEVPILVYESIPNGTLFHLIHGNNNGWHIPLVTRLRIAHESAEALAYLHSCASPPILHGDVKSSNILLDSNLSAKVSEFGASILAPTDETQFVTLVQGTCGYLDPEYMQTCQLTDKSDVYSFGVVLLELITRKKPFNLDAPENEKSLSMRFLFAIKENNLNDILDDQIKNNENMGFLEEIAELATQCLEMSGLDRPSMKEVRDKLDRLRKVIEHPWEQENLEELESLLGESSRAVISKVESTGNFSIEKKVVEGLESGHKLSEILDPQKILEGVEDVDLVAALAGECLSLNGQARPTVKNVEMRLQRLSGEDSNTVQGSKIEMYHDVSAQMSISKGSSSSKQCSIEEDALLSASFPR
uniref:Protein kinase domain-containing protein n=1 Tax=Oryza meridionalis TaxID=40149 RepID=A0A0E0ET34_9ORYZ